MCSVFLRPCLLGSPGWPGTFLTQGVLLLCLQCVEITDVYHHAWLNKYVFLGGWQDG